MNLLDEDSIKNVYDNISKYDDIEIFKQNEENILYKTYLDYIDKYFRECKGVLNSKFNYYVNENGDYVKDAIDKKDDKNNSIIKKPEYIHVASFIDKLNSVIKIYETKLKYFRTKILENDASVKIEFDETNNIYDELIKEKNLLYDYKKKYIDNDQYEKKKEIKTENINLSIEQNKLLQTIKINRNENNIIDLESNYNDYISNNDKIKQNIDILQKLSINTNTNYVIKKLYDIKKPIQQRKFKVKGSRKKSSNAEIKKKKPETEKDTTPETEKDTTPESKKGGGKKENISSGSIFGTLKISENDSFDLRELCENTKSNSSTKYLESIDLGGKSLESIDLGGKSLEAIDLGGKSSESIDLGGNLEAIDLGGKSSESIDLGGKSSESIDLGGNLESIDLGGNLESIDLSSLGDCKTVNLDYEDDEQSNIIFKNNSSIEEKNEDKSIGLKLDNDTSCTITAINIDNPKPTVKEKEKEIDLSNFNGGGSNNELDIKALSRKLNKTVKDPNIKYITVNPNLDFSKISKKNSKLSK